MAQYHRESAKEFALCARIGPNSVFLCVLGEFFRAKRPCAGLGGDAAYFRLAAVGVLRHEKPFCGVSYLCMAQLPPIGGGAAAT